MGVDVGATNIKWVVLGPGKVCIATGTVPTDARQGPEVLLERVQQLAESATDTTGLIDGIGLSLPGRVDHAEGKTIGMPKLPGKWRDRPVAAWLGSRLRKPVFLINDGSALALAEFELGAGRGTNTMLAVAIGTGIAGGVVVGGSIHFGTDDAAGEIGHIPIERNGLLCACGSRGCVETIASGEAIARAGAVDSVEEVVIRARNGDIVAKGLLEKAGQALGAAIWAAAAVIAPEVVVIGGGVSQCGELLMRPLTDELHWRSRNIWRNRVEVLQAQFGPMGGAIGAAIWAEHCRRVQTSCVLRT
jgi:glucokinase